MGGFYNRGSSHTEDAEVENLLNQVEEESILKLKTCGFGSANDSGLDDNLLVRFANLKSRPPAEVRKKQAGNRPPPEEKKNHPVGADSDAKKSQSQQVSGPDVPEPKGEDLGEDEEEAQEEDVVAAELEKRLKALKSPPHSSQSFSKQRQQVKEGSSLSPAQSSSSSSSSGKTRSFSPMKMLKQLSMTRNKPARSKSQSECGSFSSAENDGGVNKLLASAADEVHLEKKKKKKKKKLADDVDDDDDEEEEGEDDIDAERLLRDLNVKNLKKELSAASIEQGRLTREAQQVIEWAKDAALLEKSTNPGGGGSDEESDLEELLRMAEEKDEDDIRSKKKTKKGKKWSLF